MIGRVIQKYELNVDTKIFSDFIVKLFFQQDVLDLNEKLLALLSLFCKPVE